MPVDSLKPVEMPLEKPHQALKPIPSKRFHPLRETSPAIHLKIVDKKSRDPIAGARVFMQAKGKEWVSCGLSDEGGRLAVPHARELRLAAFVVKHPKYMLFRSSPLELKPGKAIELALIPGASITGRVVVGKSGRPARGASVRVWQNGREPSAAHLASWLEGSPDVPSAKVNDEGRFEITGLDPAHQYTVVAAKVGFYCQHERRRVRPGQDEVSLVLKPLYILITRVRGHAGELITVERKVWFLGMGGAPIQNDQDIDDTDPKVRLGLPRTIRSLSTQPGVTIWVLGGGDDKREVGPLKFSVAIPGYHRATSSPLWAKRADLSPTVEEIRLDSQGVGFGSISLQFQNPPESPHSLAGEVLLYPSTSSLPNIRYGFPTHDTDHPLVIKNIPVGYYSLWLISSTRVFTAPSPGSPAIHANVARHSTVSVKIDLSKMCAIAWKLASLASGYARYGFFDVSLVEKKGGKWLSSSDRTTRKPSGLLTGLSAGDYWVQVAYRAEPHDHPIKLGQVRVKVKPGFVSHAVIEIQRSEKK